MVGEWTELVKIANHHKFILRCRHPSRGAVVGPSFGRASSGSFHGFPYFLRLGDDVIRDGVPFVLGHGLPEAAYHLPSAA